MDSPRLLWTPDEATRINANINSFIDWLKKKYDLNFKNYDEVWNWSVNETETFWKTIWEYFDISYDGSFNNVIKGSMPRVSWFEGTRLNYAEHVIRNASTEHPAIIFKSESSPIRVVSITELKNSAASVQHVLKSYGVTMGDRVAAYLPGIPEATAAMLAVTSLGGVWSSCSPDFGIQAVIDRFSQIEPKVLFAVDEYAYNGKPFDKTEAVEMLANALPSLRCIIIISNREPKINSDKKVLDWAQIVSDKTKSLSFIRVPFSHPLWILFSSGTTGLPKAITHSHGGVLLEQLKYVTFHNDFKRGEKCFWYTTTGWMMWNYIHGSLLAGATMVLYDGSPGYPDLNVLWEFAEEVGIHHFGTSAAFILANIKAGIRPSQKLKLTELRSIGSTGSTLPAEGFDWVYQYVKNNIWLASMSGGTDVCSAFVGGNPTLPVYAGEIQCRALGCKLEAYNDDGQPVTSEMGEMVISVPMPSMPVYFWNDPDFKKYEESYFEMFPAKWRHGDWIEITPRGGVIIYGRSDATLNRGGIRIGTSEIYRAVDKVKEVKDSLIICIEKSGGEFWMPLFVVMQNGYSLSEELKKKINATIRSDYSARHVPDEIIAVPDIPYTISGKKTETPVKKILMGKDPSRVVNAGSLKNPESMDFFIRLVDQKK